MVLLAPYNALINVFKALPIFASNYADDDNDDENNDDYYSHLPGVIIPSPPSSTLLMSVLFEDMGIFRYILLLSFHSFPFFLLLCPWAAALTCNQYATKRI